MKRPGGPGPARVRPRPPSTRRPTGVADRRPAAAELLPAAHAAPPPPQRPASFGAAAGPVPSTSGRCAPVGLRLAPPHAVPTTGEVAAPEQALEAGLPPPPTRKFSAFSPAGAVAARLRSVRRVFPLSDRAGRTGERILVTALAPADAPAAAAILTESFADAMRTPAWARGSLASHIEGYVEEHVRMVPRALLLGARLVPAAAAGDDADVDGGGRGWEGEGGEHGCGARDDDDPLAAALSPSEASLPLVGVAELSFSETTRVKSLTLNPPPEGCYLCNTAVAPSARGQGVGAALLAAAEGAAVDGGAREVYLHLRDRDGDGPGGRLYARAGYRPAGRDPALLALVLAQDRRSLLRKRLW